MMMRVISEFRRVTPVGTVRAAAAIGIAVIGLAACSPAASPRAVSSPHSATRALAPAVNWKMPLIGAHRTTLAAARTALGTAVLLPGTGSAVSAGTAQARRIRLATSQIWVNTADVVAIVFNNGMLTIMEKQHTTTESALKVFRTALAAIKVGRAAIGRVNGHPAFIAWPRTDYLKANPSYVEFFDHSLDITIISTSLSPRTLINVAQTIGSGKT